jgi:hypothetical protein
VELVMVEVFLVVLELVKAGKPTTEIPVTGAVNTARPEVALK